MTSAYSLVAPFFPLEAARKGSNTLTTGFIISASPFSLVIVTPLCGYFLPKLGMKFTLVSGIFLVGGAFFLMGFLVDMPSGIVFVVAGILLRMTEGVGWAMCTTTTLSLLAQLFPTRVETLSGLVELGTGLGFTVGPPIGSVLFNVGGFHLPFWCVGGITIIFAILLFLLVKPTSTWFERKGASVGLSCLWIVIAGLAGIGLGVPQAIIPTYSDLLQQAHSLYPDDDKAALTSVVSGIARFSVSLREFTGPLLGRLLTQLTSFPTTSLLVGELVLAQTTLMLGVTLISHWAEMLCSTNYTNNSVANHPVIISLF